MGFQRGKPLFFPTRNNAPLYQSDSKKLNIIAEGSKILNVESIDKSVVGPNCTIEKSVVQGSVLMEGVVIEDGCQIVNSVLGVNVVIKEGMKIENCFIGDGMTVHLNEQKQLVG